MFFVLDIKHIQNKNINVSFSENEYSYVVSETAFSAKLASTTVNKI